jgi:transcriptional regulator with XRE-family HTH domain
MTMLKTIPVRGVHMTGLQARMARQALRWRYQDAAERCGVSVGTIQRVEAGKDTLMGTFRKMRQTYEQAGVEFLPDGRGIRLREPK